MRVTNDSETGQGLAPSSFAANASSTQERVLVASPIGTTLVPTYAAIPANDAEPGTVYELACGGIYSTSSSAPTIITSVRWGTGTGDTAFGASPTITAMGGVSNKAWESRFIATIRTIGGVGQGVGNGMTWLTTSGTREGYIMGTGSATITTDTTIAKGLAFTWKWSASSASNTVTCTWSHLRKYI